jgi:Dak1 domain
MTLAGVPPFDGSKSHWSHFKPVGPLHLIFSNCLTPYLLRYLCNTKQTPPPSCALELLIGKMVQPKKILNDPEHAVSEFISGLLRQYPHHLVQLEHHNVLLSASIMTPEAPNSSSATTAGVSSCSQLVHILSGGGSGHEPSHAGWIGSGMLSAQHSRGHSSRCF